MANSENVNGRGPIETDVRTGVRRSYGRFARTACQSGCCTTNRAAKQAGYNEEQLECLPESAKAISTGSGNPTALADLKRGETVLDLGSGGGIDVILAAHKVGPTGKGIGVDMTPEMIDSARENAHKSRIKNVEFRLGEIEHLPVADESVDVIISNCVINLSPDKDQVFREAYRVLKKGGRILVSDAMTSGLPQELRKSMSLWAGCMAGAIPLEEYLDKIRTAGFRRVEVVRNTANPVASIKDVLDNALATVEDKEEERVLRRLANLFEKDNRKPVIKTSHAEICAVKE
jgi:SAM-dependent methyltransferase